ncbi:MBL fold metallo-hydrolase [Kytococcus sedentarius]|uniref:Zn-dependent hydrolase, glyoxylase n=1 Tax=Kytococcus sedentarius (strain ATCC 14392 / DSM 20547 / JCM 11482 / CCUG 33030 / NBRC 15357 / NCTC 11040 / CCM 314 / 541) TaxID=478801 RepID=C7NI38_KYTSD|nr:MBL fold metallo-hydrolase [Kytococcus sedentarius]ACV06545.1 Zn-dependent hydrolase, glyoxylase [Kytococcus sedentarius DSM 20547]QQB64849.1 MBL fold metallo-hydrolase [Kytococcus sedentarius]STX14639.1 hydroxyacylglutathione hydrolase [Kytococcus sedentarius]
MFTLAIPATAFGTNCYVVAPDRGEECVVIDPGFGVVDQLRDALRENGLRPAAVLLTHGHLDHTASVTPVCGGTVGAYIHTDDRYRLTDPRKGLSAPMWAMLQQEYGSSFQWSEPDEVHEFTDAAQLEIAGLTWGVRHAPGHTEGSVLFDVADVPAQVAQAGSDLRASTFTGDVLFAGSIGRTDLPGGDPAAMQRSLREVVLPTDDHTMVLPGHGRPSTMAHERASNPYLQGL